MVRPYLRTSQPMPPPRVRPERPTLPVSPKGVARPWALAAAVYSPAVRPGCAQASRRSGSMWRPFIPLRSRTIPPSVVPWPARLWLPPRTASSRPASRANTTVRATSAALTALTMSDGPAIDGRVVHLTGDLEGRVLGADDGPGDAGDERADIERCGGSWAGMRARAMPLVPFGWGAGGGGAPIVSHGHGPNSGQAPIRLARRMTSASGRMTMTGRRGGAAVRRCGGRGRSDRGDGLRRGKGRWVAVERPVVGRERRVAQDEVGGLLGQHHHRGVDVAVGDVGHR